MNTSGTAYGSYRKAPNFRFVAMFWNPITKLRTSIYCDSEDEAKSILNKLNFDFFSENSFMLPRGISINRSTRKFMFCITLRGKTIYVFQDPDLDKVVEAKIDFIKKLI